VAAARRGLPLPPDIPSEQPSDSTVVATLRAWATYARGLPPERRAAALFVADASMEWTFRSTAAARDGPEGDAMREQLEALGATFARVYDWYYTRGWLWDAWRIRPGGSIADRIFLEPLPLGFSDDPICGATTERFRQVIERGERFLDSPHGPVIEGRAHLAIARAYADIVGLAHGGVVANTYFGSETYRGEAPSARRHAVRHYAAALDRLGATLAAPVIWREGWRVASGLPPLDTRFACTWD